LIGIAVAWLTLFSFYQNYFSYFTETGGRSHKTFKTTALGDPKELAFQQVLAEARQPARKGKRLCVLTSEWWTYAPMFYFALGRPELQVEEWASFELLFDEPRPETCDQFVAVEFNELGQLSRVRQTLADLGLSYSLTPFEDPQGRAILTLVTVAPGTGIQPAKNLVSSLMGGKPPPHYQKY
jgi:hypothetical protein